MLVHLPAVVIALRDCGRFKVMVAMLSDTDTVTVLDIAKRRIVGTQMYSS